MPGRDQSDIERVFLQASRLKGRDRKRYLDQEVGDDPVLRLSIESLLQKVAGPGEAARKQISILSTGTLENGAKKPWQRAARARLLGGVEWINRLVQFPLGPILAVVMLAGIAAWTFEAMDETVDDTLSAMLESRLQGTLDALDLWMEAKHKLVGYAAGLDSMVHITETLLEFDLDDPDSLAALMDSAPLKEFQDFVAPFHLMRSSDGSSIISTSGKVIACGVNNEQPIGATLSMEGAALFQELLTKLSEGPQGATEVIGPIDLNRFVLGGGFPSHRSQVGFAPIRDAQGEILAFFASRTNTLQRLDRIFEAGDVGYTDTYAFDRNGELLTVSAWIRLGAERGIVPTITPEKGEWAQVFVRDPGEDLLVGDAELPSNPWDARPLTRMAASAVRGESGIDMDGYSNPLGVEVLGAWAWLPDYELGVVTEMSASTAGRFTRPVKWAFGGLLVLLLLAVAAVLAFSYSLHAMRRRLQVNQLGQYTLISQIGEGGMGAVYKARHSMLRRLTALKVLKPDLVSAENITRFAREVQLTSELTHPNTIEIFDYGRDPNGIFYYVMELLDGMTLDRLLGQTGALMPARAVHLLKQICGSLKEAHAKGLIHRDIKPPNVMVCNCGGMVDFVKVLDFGLVKEVRPSRDVRLTSDLTVSGTPAYIAPERILDPEAVDARSDLYSVGVLAFNMLTGCELFEGRTSGEIIDKAMRCDPPVMSELPGTPELPAELEAVVQRCLAKKPEDRPASAGELLEQLEAIGSIAVWTQQDAQEWWASVRKADEG